MTFANPGSSKVSLYSPGVIAANRYWPCSLVTSVRVPIIAGLVMVTVTPGRTAFVLSVTVPFIAPVVALVVLAGAGAARIRTKIQPNSAERRVMNPLHCCELCVRSSLLLLPGRRRLPGQILVIDRVFDVRLVHLVPALLGPEDFLLRRGVIPVLRRIVVMARRNDLAPGWDSQRLFEVVIQLPVEVVLRHAQDLMLPAVRVDDGVLHVLAAQMHVRRQPIQRDRLRDRRDRGDRPVLGVGRNVRDLRPPARDAIDGDHLA